VPYPVYSERFLSTDLENVWYSYFVPAGKRAVIKSIVAANVTTSVHECLVYLRGRPVVEQLVQARTTFNPGQLHVVAYAGEEMRVNSSSSGLAVWVSGFLLTNPAGVTDDPGDAADPLPAESFPDLADAPDASANAP
jgi:hypothetical protein